MSNSAQKEYTYKNINIWLNVVTLTSSYEPLAVFLAASLEKLHSGHKTWLG